MIPTAIASPDSPKRIMQVSVAIAEAAIFTILFQIKIEIITDFLSDLSRDTYEILTAFFSIRECNLTKERERNETSEAEKNAERTIKKINKKILVNKSTKNIRKEN